MHSYISERSLRSVACGDGLLNVFFEICEAVDQVNLGVIKKSPPSVTKKHARIPEINDTSSKLVEKVLCSPNPQATKGAGGWARRQATGQLKALPASNNKDLYKTIDRSSKRDIRGPTSENAGVSQLRANF